MANEEAKLFVAGLPDSINEEVLKQLFEATGGTVVNVIVPKDRTTGRPRGFGFVTLSTSAEAQSAREALDGSIQGGKSISVRPFEAEPPRRDDRGMGMGPGPIGGRDGGFGAGPGGPPNGAPRGPERSFGAGPRPNPNAPDRTLYVGNLPYDCTQQELEVLINGVAAGGQVVRVHLPTDPDGRKRGFGFVTMSSPDTAKTACDALKTADLRGRRLVVNLAHPKGERPARPDGGFAGGGGFGGGGFGGPPGGFGGPPGGFGGPPAGFGTPPPAAGGGSNFGPSSPPGGRKTFDERRKKQGGHHEDGGRKRRFEREDTRGTRDDDDD